jgi:ribosomal protein L16 Arg81 hydroxylase
MKTEELFGEIGLERFIADYLHRLPLALPDVGRSIQNHGTWSCLAALLSAPDVDVLVVRQGQLHDVPAPVDLASAQALCALGCTIVVRHAERLNVNLAQIATSFGETFQAPVNVHMYATPAGCHGFSWHYDAEDVFIFQTCGKKEYQLRKNTVNPWPLEETIPKDMQYERELMPLMRVLLHAGDMLYIPCGYWHRAHASQDVETAISLAIGIMSRSAMDLFDLLRSELLRSLVWRQRLPVFSQAQSKAASERAAFARILEQLSVDVSRTLVNPEFLQRAATRFSGRDDGTDR